MRLIPILGDPRETSGPQIDRIPSTRPPWRDRQYRELKKLFFSAPSKCSIVLFGPVSNRTILKQLHSVALTSPRPRLNGCHQTSIEAATGASRTGNRTDGHTKHLLEVLREPPPLRQGAGRRRRGEDLRRALGRHLDIGPASVVDDADAAELARAERLERSDDGTRR